MNYVDGRMLTTAYVYWMHEVLVMKSKRVTNNAGVCAYA
jgi:hypothetical protein